jgi:subtilisin family serine protease/endonuclease YncB( thermonuclease family)
MMFFQPVFRRYRQSLLLGACVAFAAFVASGAATVVPGGGGGAVIVSVEAASPLDGVVSRAEALGYRLPHEIGDIHAVELAGPLDAASISGLGELPGVRYAEPVVPVKVTDTPSDPLFSNEYAYLSVEGAPAAWDISRGSSSIVVAVVDTGMDVRHVDLQANVWTNPREIPNNGIDDDGNGCTDDVNGCSFVSDSSPGCENVTNGYVNDDIGHGTFVSGVIAAAGNGKGMVGVARNVRIMPVKVLDCYGAGDSVATARGIIYAANNGARIINLSLAGVKDSQVMRDAVNEAIAKGVIVVAAAGNDGSAVVSFPARFPGVLAVGAASAADPTKRAPFSNWGPEIGVVAVGQRVIGTVPSSRCRAFLACLPEGPYAMGDGTSFSAPQVSGLAALMLSVNPGLPAWRVIDTIKNSATALPPNGQLGWAGYGRINMAEALRAVRDNRAPGDACVVATVIDGQRFTCTDGRTIRMLQIEAPVPPACGGDWAKAALGYLFLQPGRTVHLHYDVTRVGPGGETLAAPLWRGADGIDYNLSIVMVYVGLAKAADVGKDDTLFHDWALSAQEWAKAARWNMWGPNQPFAGGC